MSKHAKIMVFSPPGHGKTVLLGTAAGDERLWPMLLLDWEGGTDSIESKIREIKLADLLAGRAGDPVPGKIDVIRIREWRDFDSIYDYLTSANNIYKTVGLDSLSEMNYMNMSEALVAALRADPKHDPDIAEQRDYLRSYGQMRKLIRYFRDLPMNVFMSAGAQIQQDPITKQNQMWPQLTGKLAFEVPGLINIMGYLAIVEQDGYMYRCLYTQPTARFQAKDRTENGKLGAYVVEPTLPKILDILEGKIPNDETLAAQSSPTQ